MLYIFLDFDGVLHTHNGKRFSLVKNFESVMRCYPEVKIVFSTSWREYSNLENMKKFLPESLHEQCVGLTPLFKKDIKHIRYEEIMHYVKENNIDNWLAIDDLSVLFPPGCDNLFLVNGSEGISPSVAKILKKKIKYLLRKSKAQQH